MAKDNKATSHRKITLFIDGEYKTFYSAFANARNVFKAQEFFDRMQNNPDKEFEIIDEILDFIANDIYHKEITKDQILDGTDSSDFMDMIRNQLIAIMTRDVDGTKDFLEKKK